MIAKLPKSLLSTFKYNKVRLGNKFDGGYVVNIDDVMASNYLLSLGINTDWSFESDFLNKKTVKLEAYDGASSLKLFIKQALGHISRFEMLDGIRMLVKYFQFRQFFSSNNCFKCSNVEGNYGDNTERTFDKILEKINSNNIFLKIDIEGEEYRLLESIVENKKRFSGITIEFHNCDILLDKILTFISDLSFRVVHIHANNCGGIGLNAIPKSLEISLTPDLPLKSHSKPLPRLDFPNCRDIEDITLKYIL